MNKTWVLRGTVLLISAALSVFVLEVALRVTGLVSSAGALSVTEEQFARIPGVFVPRETVVERKEPRAPHRVTINSLGYRGEELPERRPGDTRVFFAGDSFTWGDLVHDEEALPMRLESRLQAFCRGVSVVNAGVGGTTIDSQLEMIRRGLTIDPDLVLLMFHGNDLIDLIPPTYWEMMEDNRRKKSTFPLSLVYGALNRTALWTVARRARARFGQQTGGFSQPSASPVHDMIPELKDRYERTLGEVVAELRVSGIPLVLTAFPSHRIILDDDEYTNHFPWLESVAHVAGVPYVDLLSVLQESPASPEELYFLPWDGHARPLGYDLVSVTLADALQGLQESHPWCNSPRGG